MRHPSFLFALLLLTTGVVAAPSPASGVPVEKIVGEVSRVKAARTEGLRSIIDTRTLGFRGRSGIRPLEMFP